MANWTNRAWEVLCREFGWLALERPRASQRNRPEAADKRRRAFRASIRNMEEPKSARSRAVEDRPVCEDVETSRRRHVESMRPFERAGEDSQRSPEEIQRPPRRRRRRRRGGGVELEPTPVEPNNPKGLTGGAEAPLEFDH